MNANKNKGSNFETQSFRSLKDNIAKNSNNNLLDDSCDRDVNFFNVNIENLHTPCLFLGKFKNFLENSSASNYFSILHLNMTSIKKNFENFKLFLKYINFTFSVRCFCKT